MPPDIANLDEDISPRVMNDPDGYEEIQLELVRDRSATITDNSRGDRELFGY